jgi:hypothetical protein
MRTLISLASALACAFALDAQITSTLNGLPDGVDEVRIRNNSAISLVAFVITVKQMPWSAATSNAPFVVYSDPLIEPAAKPLLANEERIVLVNGFRPSGAPSGKRFLEEPVVIAGIFAGGATTGDAALLTWLVLRRSNMLLAVETALETLSDAGRRNIPRDQLIKQFKKMADSVRRWYLPPEQQIGLRVYQPIIGKLMNLPEMHDGSPFPPANFVEQETTMLRQQRVALLESEPRLVDAFFIARDPR